MLGSASRLRGALWPWTGEQAGIARQTATADRNSERTIVRTTLAAALTTVVYAAFGTIVWSAYDQFGRPSLRDVTPLVKTRAAFVKLAPSRLSVRGSEADRPPVVATLEPWAIGGELPPQPTTAQAQDRGAGPPGPAALPAPARARSIARAAPVDGPAAPPEATALEQAFAQAEAARSDPSAGQFRQGSVAPSGTSSAAGAGAAPAAPLPAAGIGLASTPSAPPRVAAQPEATAPLPPLPSLKPSDVMIAWTSTDPALSSRGGGRTTAAAAGSGAGARTPPPPAFKPLESERILASGEQLRTAAAGSPSGLRSFWSGLIALFTAAPRRLVIADNGGSREAGFERSGAGAVADEPSRAGGDPAGRSGPGGGSGADGDKPGGGNPAGKGTNGGSVSSGAGEPAGSAASSRDRGGDRGRGGRGGRGDRDDDDHGGRGRGGDDDGGKGGGKGGGGKGGDKGGGGKGGGKGGGGKGGGKGGGGKGDDDDD
jgi:hypothetical protein